MSLATFRIDAEFGRAAITINGQDVSDIVRGYQLRHAANDVPVLTLEVLSGDGTIEGEGIVEVQQAGGDLAGVAAWIRGLDAEALSNQAANSLGMGGSVARKLLDLVAEMLDGGGL